MNQNWIFETSPSREDELLQTLVWIKKRDPSVINIIQFNASLFMIIINELGAVAGEFLDPCYLFNITPHFRRTPSGE